MLVIVVDGAPMLTVGEILSSVNAVDRLLAAARLPALSLPVLAGTVNAIVPLPLAVNVTCTVLPDFVVLTPVMLAVPVEVTFDNISEVVKLMEPSFMYGSL